MVRGTVLILLVTSLVGCGGVADNEEPIQGSPDGGGGGDAPDRARPDATPPPNCGDDTCDPDETCGNCASDCGECPAVCFDDVCEAPEDCGSCPGDCGPCIPLPDDLRPTLEALRPQYPTPMSTSQIGELLNRVAYQHRADGWALLRSTSGTTCRTPANVQVDCDVLVNVPSVWHFDVLIDALGSGIPSWQDKGPCVVHEGTDCSLSNVLAPVAP